MKECAWCMKQLGSDALTLLQIGKRGSFPVVFCDEKCKDAYVKHASVRKETDK